MGIGYSIIKIKYLYYIWMPYTRPAIFEFSLLNIKNEL